MHGLCHYNLRAPQLAMIFIHQSQIELPVAMMLSPGASTPPGGLMKQLFGAVVWNWNSKHA